MPYKDPARDLQARRERYRPEIARQRYLGWKERHPDGLWEQWLKKAHSMPPEQWFAMWDEQNGSCYICERPLPDDRGQVAIDHDHACCGEKRSCGYCRRGLAHAVCNRWVGIMGENVELMRTALANFERAQAQTQAVILTRPEQDTLPLGLAAGQ